MQPQLQPVREFELASPPTDGISNVRFAPESNFLLATSWDTGVRLYDVQTNSIRFKYEHTAAVLDACFSDNTHCFSGGVDRTLKTCELSTGTEEVIGSHDNAIRCVEYSRENGLVITGSWDKTIKTWDSRQVAGSKAVATIAQPDKIYTMAVAREKLVIGMNNRHVHVYDLRRMNEPLQRRESSLMCQTRCIRTFIDHTGYSLSSIDGRVAVEYFDPAEEVQAKKYAFKCHRSVQNNVTTVYPVNCIAFHPRYGTFATGGCDNLINIWDHQNRKRLTVTHRYPSSIASLAFNHDGTMLAIASSYTWEQDQKEHEPDSIFIRFVQDTDVMPKQRP
eukprot:gnl/Hemi2/7076_TR2420_c0_g1_i1.p1 gnl/Hemi2/7076_TR2420_c0_g1~~gnl/Hemi2/7076_TR2420_c0_g1_i1.p1  ORF type:complete len:350 (+),score=68.19 gnl/Hemi2/7076_TR2420_c0_g1_i1:50-1051(+)